jgi:hypothetical protein
MKSITAVFERAAQAESAIGRLEVAGVLPEDITLNGFDKNAIHGCGRSVVIANFEPRLMEKAMGILNGEGTINAQSDAA